MTSGIKMAWFGAVGAFVSYLFCFELNKLAIRSFASEIIHVKNKSDDMEARMSRLESSLPNPNPDPIFKSI